MKLRDKMKTFEEKTARSVGKRSFTPGIRQKMLAANIMMILVPTLAALILFAAFFNGHRTGYWEEIMEYILRDNNNMMSAESIIRSCDQSDDLDAMQRELSRTGYHSRIEKDGQITASGLTQEDLAAGEKLAGPLAGRDSDYTISNGRFVVIRSSFQDEGSRYVVTAVRTPVTAATIGRGDSYIKGYIEWFIGIMLAILIAVILLLNVILYRWTSRSIVRPLDQLSRGSERIREGDLDFDMKTTRRDEIGRVMNDFDEMRGHLQDSVEERLRYEKYRRELIIGISHDLRTPLTSIKGYVEGLRDGIANTPEKKEKYYQAIEVSVADLERLTADLTDFSRIESESRSLDIRETELNEFYRSCVKDMENEYMDEPVEIVLEESEEPLYAGIDREEMKRVHYNLVENAIKYKNKDRSRFTIRLSREEDEAVIRFADDGPGVPESDLDHVFDFFFRGDASRTDSAEGSGIGLAVVKEIVLGLGGTVGAQNDDGFVVIIRLPLKKEAFHEEDPHH